MVAHISILEAAKFLGAGTSFLVLATGLGYGLAQLDVTSREVSGRLRHGPCAVIALSCALLVAAHMMAVWFLLELFHPALLAFYCTGAGIMVITTRARHAIPALPPR